MAKHYGNVEWLEYVRGLVSEDIQATMTEHLSEGCLECRDSADFYIRLVSICAGMVDDDVPEPVMERARSIGPLASFGIEHSVRVPIELLFDSSSSATPAGLRGSKNKGWRILYRAGDYSLDFHVEPDTGASRISIIGQILVERPPQGDVSNLPVLLRSGKITMAETLSNQFGEFRLECEQRKQLLLCIYLNEGARYIEVPLHNFGKNNRGSEQN